MDVFKRARILRHRYLLHGVEQVKLSFHKNMLQIKITLNIKAIGIPLLPMTG